MQAVGGLRLPSRLKSSHPSMLYLTWLPACSARGDLQQERSAKAEAEEQASKLSEQLRELQAQLQQAQQLQQASAAQEPNGGHPATNGAQAPKPKRGRSAKPKESASS